MAKAVSKEMLRRPALRHPSSSSMRRPKQPSTNATLSTTILVSRRRLPIGVRSGRCHALLVSRRTRGSRDARLTTSPLNLTLRGCWSPSAEQAVRTTGLMSMRRLRAPLPTFLPQRTCSIISTPRDIRSGSFGGTRTNRPTRQTSTSMADGSTTTPTPPPASDTTTCPAGQQISFDASMQTSMTGRSGRRVTRRACVASALPVSAAGRPRSRTR